MCDKGFLSKWTYVTHTPHDITCTAMAMHEISHLEVLCKLGSAYVNNTDLVTHMPIPSPPIHCDSLPSSPPPPHPPFVPCSAQPPPPFVPCSTQPPPSLCSLLPSPLPFVPCSPQPPSLILSPPSTLPHMKFWIQHLFCFYTTLCKVMCSL